jgi:tetratricopeptide (TPR) repeat protein
MERVEKTVFISYRRTNISWALAIFQSLTQSGYDVFLDYKGIASGDFERVILENIAARAHFVVLLTPSALERCDDQADWLRREIEMALDSKRNIVPLMLEGFDFATPGIADRLTGRLAALRSYNALRIPPDYFDSGMERLCSRYLSIPLTAVLHPLGDFAQRANSEQMNAAKAAPTVETNELTAQHWFEHGFAATTIDEQINCYSEAVRFKPDFAEAFYERGSAQMQAGNDDEAVEDFTEAIRLKPDHVDAHYERGVVRRCHDDREGAVQDFTEAIRLNPDHAQAFFSRGNVRSEDGDSEGAIQDFTVAIRLDPANGTALFFRGCEHSRTGDVDSAILDYTEVVRLEPTNADAFESRGEARRDKGDIAGAREDFEKAESLRTAAP